MIFNNETGFMEARNANGSWAGQDAGWTEGDMWAYTFDVVHDVPALITRRGGNASFVKFLDEHFDGGEQRSSRWELFTDRFAGHNDHTNEVSGRNRCSAISTNADSARSLRTTSRTSTRSQAPPASRRSASGR